MIGNILCVLLGLIVGAVIMGCAKGGNKEEPLDYEYWKKVGNEITNHNKNYQKGL